MTSVSDSPLNRSRNRPVLARYKPTSGYSDQVRQFNSNDDLIIVPVV